MRTWVAAILAIMLASCHGAAGTSHASVSEGRFIDANERLMLVELSQSGQLTNEVTLPLDPRLAVRIGDKEASIRQIPTGTPIKIWRDDQTRRVVRVEAGAAEKKK